MRIAATVVALALCALPASADKKLDEAIRKAELALAKGKEADALKILQKEASRSPRDPEALTQAAHGLGSLPRGDHK